MFDKSAETFPNKNEYIFLAHCSVSPLYSRAGQAMQTFSDDIAAEGFVALPKYFDLLSTLHRNAARLLRTTHGNISYVHNTAEAMCLLANGYPFQPGDEVISYAHEYPSNHYPWLLQRRRGVKLILLSDADISPGYEAITKPKGWSMAELERKVTRNTRVIAISHVQYSSGYAANLIELGEFCHLHGIDLIVDCAQSLGSLPVYPEEYHISAVAASAWKWLMGPWGSGLLYTGEEFREKIAITMTGADQMQQGLNYLDLRWNPKEDGRVFEYSTLPWDHIAGLNVLLEDVFLPQNMEAISREIFRLQDLLVAHLDTSRLQILNFPEENRSGILAAEPRGDFQEIVAKLLQSKIVVSAPIGYLRFAPHFYNDDEQIIGAAARLNELL